MSWAKIHDSLVELERLRPQLEQALAEASQLRVKVEELRRDALSANQGRLHILEQIDELKKRIEAASPEVRTALGWVAPRVEGVLEETGPCQKRHNCGCCTCEHPGVYSEKHVGWRCGEHGGADPLPTRMLAAAVKAPETGTGPCQYPHRQSSYTCELPGVYVKEDDDFRCARHGGADSLPLVAQPLPERHEGECYICGDKVEARGFRHPEQIGPYCEKHEDLFTDEWHYCGDDAHYATPRWAVASKNCLLHGGVDYIPRREVP